MKAKFLLFSWLYITVAKEVNAQSLAGDSWAQVVLPMKNASEKSKVIITLTWLLKLPKGSMKQIKKSCLIQAILPISMLPPILN